ncbi:DUF805 domain-containing protein [Agromyces sp. Leaf222]|uniref:DUF805 domain-containing protein n=1 Tax=Agromyces sp. Leaf222 TaxID=1735688 RepID=UPI0006F5CE99|nr:DUF805 domain-containing protein [Agromyces sp. Leaf222]KQM82075.1 hypothetical protein ASE68_01130 [Agromyces sp. Leaf222]
MTYAPAQQPASAEPPLSQPLYGASLGQAIKRFFTKYATFSGRASRSEYWWWTLANVIVTSVLSGLLMVLAFSGATIDATTGTSQPGPLFGLGIAIYALWYLAVLIPSLALIWRRLHDTSRSGGFFFLSFIPLVGSIIVLIFMLLDSDPAGARFDD